jgi:hypothetical protein
VSWLLLLNAAVAAATAASAPPATPAAGVAEVRVINESARWTGLLAMNELKDDAESMFLISGEVENAGSAPVSFVKLGYELLADTSDGEVVLASEYGYNFRAEALRSPPVEAGDVAPTAVPVRPLGPGEKDLFRMVFFRSDVPRFDRWRVRILEVR